ncbi:hypothetical protein OHB05_42450 [Streptomyces sp. NBC_00638]|uniref:hypothetical protein n=1 Tax=Streptomyces sp. NBC_00638 TaxID=2975794 RepID=UPI00225B17E8|nr:hypothetical protein [Streptomyces sp. NBC_00638]MCX5009180.1 hypothetical protein [Streptomyces sp. NBC_00638]
MTTASPRLLLITAVLLAATGVIVLSMPSDRTSPATASSGRSPVMSPRSSPVLSLPASSIGSSRATGWNSATAMPPREPVSTTALPPHGEGVDGDRAIQRALEKAWPADLSPADEQQLCTEGKALLRADATGIGRASWPDVFEGLDQAVAPAFATARFRVQAVVARRDGTAHRAVVHLVWAGADRGGTYTDGRITDWYFTRTISKKGAPTWNPQHRR